MAAPMRETSASHPPTTANFEYDDNEWDIGIGDLIIDLDADIEKTGVGEGMAAPKPGKMHPPVEHQATVDKGLKMKIKRTKPGTKHEIVKSGENGEKHPNSAKRGSSGHRREKKHGDKPGQKDINGVVRSVERVVFPVGPGPPVKEKRPTGGSEEGPSSVQPPTKKIKTMTAGTIGSTIVQGQSSQSGSGGPVVQGTAALAQQLVQQSPQPQQQSQQPQPQSAQQQSQSQPINNINITGLVVPQPSPQAHLMPPTLQSHQSAQVQHSSQQQTSSPPLLQHQSADVKELIDVGVGTSIGTITEPDCLGPCEPGTSVTLEGIVWHETEGVLVVNVTWRGKTYVGTLLDCTRHDWAPPRFCDSPTSDIDTRTPKGRGKRGRNSANASICDLSNFTETRSSVHSKLRSNNASGPKGRKGQGSASPTSFAAPKVDSTPGKRKAKPPEEETNKRKNVPPPPSSSPLASPVLLECPEPNCSKKYKHINGLKYHQSHAHGSPDDEEAKESGSDEEAPSPSPEVKKDEINAEIPTTIGEESIPEPEEKTILRFNNEDVSSLRPVSTPLITRASTPRLTSPSSIEPQSVAIPAQPSSTTKIPQFKVKPASVLMGEEKKCLPSTPINNASKLPTHKKKCRKSPAGSPHPAPLEPPSLGIEKGREDIQSPAYSDISDDAAPLLESEVEGKPKQNVGDKKESEPSPLLQHYGMYPYYGQPPHLVPSVPDKSKDASQEKSEGKPPDKEKKENSGDYPQKLLQQQQQHYFQFSYLPAAYPYNMDSYNVVIDERKEDKVATSSESKQAAPPPPPVTQLHIPNPVKSKTEQGNLAKDKHPNDNHQILKESIEMKNQMNPSFLFQRQQPSQDELRRYYVYQDRKENNQTKATPPPSKMLSMPSPKHKDKEEKKERKDDDKKQEGVKPTMETQGPPPPPTSQYAYIHPGYMQSPHYGLPFDPNHPMYRGVNPMLLPGYTNSPYIHPQLHAVPRYHAPEDLSRPQSGKALDLLQHHASQYYAHPTHKIHELQERAIKSPTPKTSTANSASPSGSALSVAPVTSSSVQVQEKPTSSDIKDTRSPPPQRHVHTHHHTHVGLGYPILAGQYPAPYGAAVLASEHAAAISSVPYQAK